MKTTPSQPNPALRNLPLSALRAFEAVGRHCHVRRAAEEMHISHTALSRSVKQLEEQLGVALFDRQRNRLSLTAAGRRLLGSVQAAFGQLADGLAYLDPARMAGELVVATTSTIAMGWLLEVLGNFQQRFPEITLRMITLAPRQQELPAEFDVAVCLGEPAETVRSVTRLYQENYVPVCSPKLLRTDQPVQEPADLLAYPLIHDRLSQWQRWFQQHQLPYSKGEKNFYVDYGYQAIHASRLGLGVMLADTFEVVEDLRDGRLVSLLGQPMPVQQSAYLVHDAPEQISLPAQLLVTAIFEHLRRQPSKAA